MLLKKKYQDLVNAYKEDQSAINEEKYREFSDGIDAKCTASAKAGYDHIKLSHVGGHDALKQYIAFLERFCSEHDLSLDKANLIIRW